MTVIPVTGEAQQPGRVAHPLALQQPDGVGGTHQAVGPGNLLERVGCALFAQMMHQQQPDAAAVRQGFQRAHILVIAGVSAVIRVGGADLLQGVDDHQPGFGVLGQEFLDLEFQPVPDGAAADMMEQLFWLDEEVPGIINLVRTQRSETRYNANPNFSLRYDDNDDWPPDSPVAMWFNSTILNDFLKDWAEVQRKLRQREITEKEYFEWKICWPESADK